VARGASVSIGLLSRGNQQIWIPLFLILEIASLESGRRRWTIRQYATQRFPIPGETNFAAVNQLFRLIQHMPYTLG